jgi:hypothetical protein
VRFAVAHDEALVGCRACFDDGFLQGGNAIEKSFNLVAIEKDRVGTFFRKCIALTVAADRTASEGGLLEYRAVLSTTLQLPCTREPTNASTNDAGFCGVCGSVHVRG